MPSLFGIAAFCVVLCLGGTAQSYFIDTVSCGNDVALVREIVEQALTMATATSDAIGANPLDAYTTFLLQQLFNPPNGNAQEEVQKTFQKRTATTGDITGILSFREEKTGDIPLLLSYEVVIFCDETRFEKVDWSDELWYVRKHLV
ncbi:hypothetical protein F4819DRAFT_501445 [Hypoxylon fuscum]|nr:hypothetical protein F4819DRAFT_501445 [Hypoxylon fuscum]